MDDRQHGSACFFRKFFFATVPLMALALFSAGCDGSPSVSPAAATPSASQAVHAGTIVAVGDSLTAGLGVSEDQAYPAQLARRLQESGYPYRVINAGVSGETSSGLLSRIDWVISSLAPDIVVLETGANDGMRGLDLGRLEANLDRLVTILRSHRVRVVLAGMQMLPNLGPDYVRVFSEIYPRIAEKHDIILVPFFLEGVAAQDHLNQADNIHPNPDGYARVVQTIYPYVVEAIDRHRASAHVD